MSSLTLDFGAADEAAREYRRFVRAVDDAVAVMSLDIAAGACGIANKSDLRAMLDGRNGRRLPADVGAVIARRVGTGEYQDAILDAIRGMYGLYAPESDAAYAHRLEGALLRFGEPGANVLAQCRREARR